MAGTFRKIGDGRWELCVNLGYDLNGKRIRKYKYVDAKGKREVESLLAEFVANCQKATFSNYGDMTLKEFHAIWMKDYAKNNLRKKTISRYQTLWPRIETCLGKFKMANIRPTHLIRFYNMLKEDGIRIDGKPGGLSPTTIKHHHALISTILETAVCWELIPSNPCSKIKISKLGLSTRESRKKVEDSVYTLEQTIQLLDTIDSKIVDSNNNDIKHTAVNCKKPLPPNLSETIFPV